MSKSVLLAVFISLSTMIALYLLGYLFEIDILKFKIASSKTEIALLPIAIGLVIAFISDRIIKLKANRSAN